MAKNINVNWDAIKDIAGSQNIDVIHKYANDILNSLFYGENTPGEEVSKLLNACISIVQGIKPQDPLEAQLIAQMIGAHNTAMECLRRANIENQTFVGRKASLDHAHKFMRIYIDQLNALNKHRGKGQQKVTVEYVNIESGGNAIVGNVSTEKKRDIIPSPTPALSHQAVQAINPPLPPEKEKASHGSV